MKPFTRTRFAVALSLGCLASLSAHGDPEPRTCAAPTSAEQPLLPQPVAHNLAELGKQYQATYQGERRLAKRAYWHPSRKEYVAPYDGALVTLPAIFLRSLVRHLELALQRGYADFLFFSDMGHAHLFLPEAKLREIREDHGENSAVEQAVLGSPDLKLFYHTAELLQLRKVKPGSPLPQDPWLAWRYFSRNFWGDNVGGESLAVVFAKDSDYNTVRKMADHQEWSGLRFSASKDGCFVVPSDGHSPGKEPVYFDLALEL